MNSAIARIRSTLARHRGWRGLSVLLTFALLCMTWPHWEVHVHADVDHAHPHHHDHDAPDPPAPADPLAPGIVHVHVHDAHSTSFTLTVRNDTVIVAPRSLWHAPHPVVAAACPARPPPHRPPIA